MRLTQVLNYLAIAYVPFVILLLRGGVKDVPDYHIHVSLGIAYYIGSQISKGLIFASGVFDLLGLYRVDERILTNLVNIIDFIFIYHSLKFKGVVRTERVLKKLPLSAGWALCEVFVHYIASFAKGFRDKDFKFRYFFNAFEANYRILSSLVSYQLVFHFNRTSFKSRTKSSNLLAFLIILHFFALPLLKSFIPRNFDDVSFLEFGNLAVSILINFSIYYYVKKLEGDLETKKSQ